MAEVRTAMVRYVFIDVVGFTSRRSVEAQGDVVAKLNQIVLEALDQASIADFERILIPTGDGICIAIQAKDAPYDVHMDVARRILSQIQEHNAVTDDGMRQFQVRIGINANIDNLIRDVNDRPNLAGAGISTAQRIMDLAGPSNVLVASAVHDVLATRERYMEKFKAFAAEAKHGGKLTVYLYVDPTIDGLSTAVPSSLALPKQQTKRLSELAAAYMAEVIENETEITRLNGPAGREYALIALLYYRAQDRVSRRYVTKARPDPSLKAEPAGASFGEQFDYYYAQDFWLVADVQEVVTGKVLGPYWESFEEGDAGPCFVYVTAEGKKRLESEWPGMLEASRH